MTFKFSNLLVGTLALMTTACNAGEVSTPVDPGKGDYIKTSKPGASVFISSDYDGTAMAGEERVVRIKVSDQYPSGTLRVSIVPNADLLVSGGETAYVFDMSGDRPHEISVSIKALSEGVHYLNLKAVAEYGDQQVARATSAVTFNAGVELSKGLNRMADEAPVENKSGSDVVVMEAEEEIIVNKDD